MIYFKILEAIKNWLPFIEKHWKTFLFIVVSILAIIFYLRGERLKRRAEDAEAGRDAVIKINNQLSAEVHRYRNKQGDTVVGTKSIGIPKSQVDALLKDRDLQWLKKFDDLKNKNLQSAETFDVSFKDDVVKPDTVTLPCKDAVKAEKYSYKDEWNDIEATVIGKPKLEIRDKYFGIVHLKRPKGWFFKFQWSKREAIAEITNSNKLIRIDSLVNIQIK